MTDTAHATALYGSGIDLGRYIGKGGLSTASALQVAFSLASNKGASLSIHVLPPEPSEPLLMAGSPLLQLNSETERLDRLTATTLEAAKKFFAQSGINMVYNRSWFPADSPTQRLLELARTHDITILDSPGVTAGSSEQAIEDCLLSSGNSCPDHTPRDLISEVSTRSNCLGRQRASGSGRKGCHFWCCRVRSSWWR